MIHKDAPDLRISYLEAERERLHAMCYRLADHLADAAEVLGKLAVGYRIERIPKETEDDR